MGSSYSYGKQEVKKWIEESFHEGCSVLDVGCGEGIWSDMLKPRYKIDGVEIFKPYVLEHDLKSKYRNLYICDVEDVLYDHYDLVIFGDVIEHMSIHKAQKVLEYAKKHSFDHIVAVPWLYKQGPINGNELERHVQDDLTLEIFNDRYPGYSPIWTTNNYAYFNYTSIS